MSEIISNTMAMTNDEAIDYLLQMRNLYDDENGNCYLALTMAIKALTDEKWIPVAERMPEEQEEEYEIFDEHMGFKDYGHRMESDLCLVTLTDDDGEPAVYGSYTVEGKFPNGVVAWRPLPEPYMGGK